MPILTSMEGVKALMFILVLVYFSGFYFFFNDYFESFSTIIGTYFSILGVGVALYVASWVYGIERKKGEEYDMKINAENTFYRRMVIHDLYGLMTSIQLMQFHWPNREVTTEEERKASESLRATQADIDLRCSDLEKINNNVYAPPDIRQRVLLICRQSGKVINHPHMMKDIFGRIEGLLDTKYMSEITDAQIRKWMENMRRNIEETK